MRFFQFILSALALTFFTQCFAENIQTLKDVDYSDFKQVEKAAWAGDYQAQRNLAYGYASFPMKGQTMNKVLGCAWYQAIVFSGSPKLNTGDHGNLSIYCAKLGLDEAQKANEKTVEILRKVPRY